MMADLMVSKENPSSSITEGLSQKMKEKKNVEEFVEKGENTGEGLIPLRTSGDKSKFKRLEMPIISGENPDSCLFRVVRYFEIHQLTKWEKITAAIISFDEYVVNWYRWSHNRKKIKSWEDLKAQMFKRFRPSQEGSLCARFLAIKQEESVAEYIKKFEVYLASLSKLPETVLENTFLNGLKPTVKAAFVSRRPIGLEEIMLEAQLIEDRDLAIKPATETMGQGSYYDTLKPNATSGGKANPNMREKTNPKSRETDQPELLTYQKRECQQKRTLLLES